MANEAVITIERIYTQPTWVRDHLSDPLARFMIRRGMTPGGESADGSGMRVLTARGRKSGRLYQRPVAVAAVESRRYIVSLWGESQWARNLRADPSAQLQLGRRGEAVEAHELESMEEKEAVLLDIAHQYPFFARATSRSTPRL